MNYFYIFSLIVAILFSLSPSSMTDWNHVTTKEGIEVYTKNDSEGRNWTKLVTSVNARPADVIKYASDVTKFNEWIYACSEAKLLEKTDNSSIYYYVTDLPFPLTDRDAVIERRASRDVSKGSYSSHSKLSSKHETSTKLVRLQDFEAIWFFEDLPDGRTKLTYEVYVNPGGNIPTWLADKFSSNGPFKSIQNLKMHFE